MGAGDDRGIVARPVSVDDMDQTRIHGIDVARGLAMLGMVVVHYVWADGDTGPAAMAARAMDGRAMPLFMLLGGIGVVLVSRRSPHPDRGLVIRAVILMVLGLILHETTERIAIVLQFYGLLFLVAPLLRRLPLRLLAASAVGVAAIGAWTFQTVGSPRQVTSFELLRSGWPGLRSLLFDGYYPFFPVFTFFAIGMVIGHLDLRSRRQATMLAGVGAAVWIGTLLVASGLGALTGATPGDAPVDGSFHAARLLDGHGHSMMPVWVASAAGTSVAVLGLSLLAAERFGRQVRSLAVVGTMALTFYVYQALATNIFPSPSTTGLAREWASVAELYISFLAVAVVWRYRFRSGPLEALLRVGSGRRAVSRPATPPRRRPGAPAPRPPSVGTPPR